MHLERDAFTICYVPDKANVEDIMTKIRSLGYRPERVVLADLEKAPAKKEKATTAATLPELISTSLKESIQAQKLLLLDFYASWCAPCRKLERDMSRPEVKRALGGYLVAKVDTDKYPKAASYFKVKALPTLIVLDRAGKVLFKHVGAISPNDLTARLGEVIKQASKKSIPK